jgi:thiol:disulfide interchange protein DsbD
VEAPARPAAGSPFSAAVVLHVPAGWHIYWENPGQSGLPTEVTLKAGPASAAGPLLPTPERIEADGLVNYGYAGETAFLFTVPAPPPGELKLAAQATWLLCRDICVRGEGSATLAVSAVAGAAASPDPTVARRAHLPRPFAESGGEATLRSGRLRVRLPGPGPFEVFPTAPLEAVWTPVPTEVGGALVLDAPLTNPPPGAALVLKRRSDNAAFRLELSTLQEPL